MASRTYRGEVGVMPGVEVQRVTSSLFQKKINRWARLFALISFHDGLLHSFRHFYTQQGHRRAYYMGS